MKKMHVTVNGVRFDVEVEVYDDDEQYPYITGGHHVSPPARHDTYSNIQVNTLMNQQTQKVFSKKTESDVKIGRAHV